MIEHSYCYYFYRHFFAEYPREKFERLMVTALVKNRPNFVEFFIDEELVDLSTCLTASVLKELYNASPSDAIFRKLAEKFELKQTNGAWPLDEIGKLIHKLSGTYYNQRYCTETSLFQHPFQVRLANCYAHKTESRPIKKDRYEENEGIGACILAAHFLLW